MASFECVRSLLGYVAVYAVVASQPVVVAADELLATHLRCEYLTEPMAIDDLRPRLSWIVTSTERSVLQSAYRVVVASSPELLNGDRGDLWDSGKVESDNTTAIEYAGKALTPGQRCYWKVRVWDQEDRASNWSVPTKWTTGLLRADAWTSEWIGYDRERVFETPEAPLAEAAWICHAEDAPGEVPKGNRVYIRRFTLPEDVVVESAEVLAIADNKHWMAVNGKMIIHGEPGWQRVKPVMITEVLQSGENEIRFNVENESVGPSGLLGKVTIATSDGSQIVLVSDDAWQSTDAPGMHWSTESLDDKQLTSCQVVAPYGSEPWGTAKVQGLFLPPVPRLRKEFNVPRPILAATLYATALGNCDVYLNGTRVSEERFTPGWTDYAKRVYYRSYDVTHLLQSGANAVGAELADGWFAGYVGWGRNRDHYGRSPRLRLQLHLQYEDGAMETVGSDATWKAAAGPTQESDFLMGEMCDARRHQDGWCAPGFDDASWHAVDVGAEIDPIIESHPGPSVVQVGEFEPVKITEPKPGVHVFDLGQNFAGVVRLKVDGEAGQKIRLRFAERLKTDGTLYTTNLRGARTVDTYICRGGGTEVWEPRFTFHGFQYVEVTGLTELPKADTIVGVALSSDTPRAGWFECSDPMINRLHENTRWTQSANFIDIPTDCPQRDERLGWTGDAQVYVATACLNADVQSFFDKWLVDLRDAQRADGQFPQVAPLKLAGDDGGPAWADAGVVCPWTIYEVYADRRLLAENYDAMKRFVEFCRQRSTGEFLPPDEFHCFGDWLSINAETPKEVIYTAYFAHSTRLLAKAAEVLGHVEDAARYETLFANIKQAFNKAYVDSEGRVRGETQCCYVLALAMDLLDEPLRQRAAEHLVADIEQRGFHLSTGFVGTKDLMLVLSKIGRNDVAYRLLHNDTFPSWGFSIKQGATSIWERWDGWTPERGFHDPGMNSFAHYSFGAVYQWMVENIGGIRRLSPAYKRIAIVPQIDDQLSWSKTDYDSIRGRISSHWTRENSQIRFDVSIPTNTTAEIHLPAADADVVFENGRPVAEMVGLLATRVQDDVTVLDVGSGEYSFVVKAAP